MYIFTKLIIVTLSEMAGVKRDITILCIVGCNGCVPNQCVAISIALFLLHRDELEATIKKYALSVFILPLV